MPLTSPAVGQTFENQDFSGVELLDFSFCNCSFINCSLKGAVLLGLSAENCRFLEFRFPPALLSFGVFCFAIKFSPLLNIFPYYKIRYIIYYIPLIVKSLKSNVHIDYYRN